MKDYPPLKKPRVSVVIPAYNEAARLSACIGSLRAQDYGPLEIIVTDDGSTDGTAELAASLGVKVMRGDHKGAGAARNAGIRAASGDVVVLADADMTFSPSYVSELIIPITEGKALASCHWNELVANWENPWARCETWFFGLGDHRRQPLEPPDRQYVYRAVRRDFFLDSGGYEENAGRGDDGSIATRTGVFAAPAPKAACFHFNAAGPGEAFGDAVWRGKNFAVKRQGLFLRALFAYLWHYNPVLALVRGARLALRKNEPRLSLYSAVFSAGFLYGLAKGICTGRYEK